MKDNYIFLFDLDSTITKAEILPTIAKRNNKEQEMRELTEKTMMGDLLFEESFTKRVEMLKDIPISEVADLVENIPVNEKLVQFLNENKERCYIVTSNLDVWINKLMKKIGMDGHFFCSKAKSKNDHITTIEHILKKEEIVKKFKGTIVATGDGSNDRKMLEISNIKIGYGGVRNIAPTLFDVIDYAIYDEKKIYEFLNKLINKEHEKDKTIIISCAGMGKRLGMEMPKALVELDGKPLIIRNLEMLDKCNDIRIVVGYKAKEVIDMVNTYRKDITFVFNHNYMNNGTGASVCLASKFAREYILTIDGDLLVHPNDMKDILEETEEFIGVCKASTDNPVLTSVKDNKVIEFSREKGEFEWTGISLIKTSNLPKGDGHVYQLIEPSLPMKYKIIRTKEIDTINDYENAQRWLKNNYSDNITIGIGGGMGSYATVNLFKKIVDAFPAQKEWDRPRIIIDNRCNMPSRVRAILYKERKEELVKSLSDSIDMMIKNNADYIILACNTSHVFLNEIYNILPESRKKIVHIIKECAKEIKQKRIKEVKLYASEGTIQSKIYNNIFKEYGIKIYEPKKLEYAKIRKWIEDIKVCNGTEENIKSFIEEMNNQKYPVILGCTELPILYGKCKDEINIKVFDPLESAIKYLVKKQNERLI